MKSLCVISHRFSIRKTLLAVSILSPICRCLKNKDDPIFTFFRSCSASCQFHLNFAENFHCSVTWQIFHSNTNGSLAREYDVFLSHATLNHTATSHSSQFTNHLSQLYVLCTVLMCRYIKKMTVKLLHMQHSPSILNNSLYS